eukprot:scaffold2140_cov394-Prasinococcus_capsulatus_cf.AAC.24
MYAQHVLCHPHGLAWAVSAGRDSIFGNEDHDALYGGNGKDLLVASLGGGVGAGAVYMAGEGGMDILYTCGTPVDGQVVVTGAFDTVVEDAGDSLCENPA